MLSLLWWRNFWKFIHLTTFLNTDFHIQNVCTDINFSKPIFRHYWNFLHQFSDLKCFIPIFQLRIIFSHIPIIQLNSSWYQLFNLNFVLHQIFSHQFSNSEFFTHTNFLTLTFRLLKFLTTIFQLRTSSPRPIFRTKFPTWNIKTLIFQQKIFPLILNI